MACSFPNLIQCGNSLIIFLIKKIGYSHKKTRNRINVDPSGSESWSDFAVTKSLLLHEKHIYVVIGHKHTYVGTKAF